MNRLEIEKGALLIEDNYNCTHNNLCTAYSHTLDHVCNHFSISFCNINSFHFKYKVPNMNVRLMCR